MSLPKPEADDTVVITGASSGIGTELARLVGARGHGLTLVARRVERLEELAEELRLAYGVRAQALPCDVGDQDDRAALIGKLRSSRENVVGVCNNAGFGSYGRFHELSLEREQEMVRVNVEAVHELSGAFLDGMVERGAGAILNVGSIAGFQPVSGFATYGATKAFVIAFSEALSADLAGTGVSCTVLCPGPVRTEFSAVAGVEDLEEQAPGPFTVEAEEVARQGLEGMVKGRRSVIPGLSTKAIATGGRFVPRTVLLPLSRQVVRSRRRG
jgi:short-subunit dehydrogenase